MLRWRHVRSFDSPQPACHAWPASAGRALAVCLLLCGCINEKQQRFQEFNNEGVALFKQGDYSSALEHFQYAQTQGQADANLIFNLGHCYDRLGQADKAESYYRQCLQINANHAECHHALAVLLYHENRKPEADDMIQTWLASQPELGPAYADDGWRLRQMGDIVHAVGRFQQALHYDSRNVRALVEMGMIDEEELRPDLALTLYRRALEYDPQNVELKSKIDRLRTKGVGNALPD